MHRLIALVGACLVLASAATGATVYVPDHFPTIQDALDAVASGDTVIVRPGTYVEIIDFVGKAVTVTSESGPAMTVIDGHHMGCVVTFMSGEGAGSILEGFTVTNGYGLSGGGVSCRLISSPTLRDNTIRGSIADQGGGIYCDRGSSPAITGNTIAGNTSIDEGGGIFCAPGSIPIIEGNSVCGNISTTGRGGGIACDESSAIIEENAILDNVGGVQGGGILCERISSPLIAGNTISGNSASFGGGIYSAYSCTPVISGNRVSDNLAVEGGGICGYKSTVVIEDNIIEGNRATHHGGGVHLRGSQASLVADNRISGNSAFDTGGGICCYFGSTATVTGNILAGNRVGRYGGGIACYSSSLATIEGNIIAGNEAFQGGAGFVCWAVSIATVTNCTIMGNRTRQCGGGILCKQSCTVDVANSILWDNHAPAGPEIWVGGWTGKTTVVAIAHSTVEGGQQGCTVDPLGKLVWGSGMISSDPLVLALAGGDLHLTWNSPCRNTGDNAAVSAATDFEGDPRIVQGTVDMGADEFDFHLYHGGDALPGSPVDIKVVGIPGLPALLALGTGIQDPPQSTPHGDLWLKLPTAKSWRLGAIPSSGILTHTATIPSGWPSGSRYPFQSLVGPWGGTTTRLTNLHMLTVE